MKSNYIGKEFKLKNFKINDNNSNAYKEIENIVKNGDTIYTPLCLFGLNGVGKTHLLKAVISSESYSKLLYTTIYDFLNSFTDSMINQTMGSFREKYLKLDILLIDDFEFIVNKEGTQEEMYQIFKHLTDLNKVIIIASSFEYSKLSLIPKLDSLLKHGNIINIKEDSNSI
jgi:chromosomal replication initiator protein